MSGNLVLICYKCNKVLVNATLASIPANVEIPVYCKDCIGFIDTAAMRSHSLWKQHPKPTKSQNGQQAHGNSPGGTGHPVSD